MICVALESPLAIAFARQQVLEKFHREYQQTDTSRSAGMSPSRVRKPSVKMVFIASMVFSKMIGRNSALLSLDQASHTGDQSA